VITIIDYGMGNLGSVLNMLKKIGSPAIIQSEPEEILQAEKLILPGVGSFDAAMNHINESGLLEVLNKVVLGNEVPILGICLGMQLMMEGSEEGKLSGFGWIKGNVFNFNGRIPSTLKVPHMGWNEITKTNQTSLTKGLSEEARFYFVHSYFVKVKNRHESILECNYGIDFDAAFNKKNIFGVQFHPEKSHGFGLQLLRNFASLRAC
jgi:imidazole glycerol-phosphate synthase subunit HisH